jgi:hypothetical protein
MKKRSIKNLALHKKSISRLQTVQSMGGQLSVRLCQLTPVTCISKLTNCVQGCPTLGSC